MAWSFKFIVDLFLPLWTELRIYTIGLWINWEMTAHIIDTKDSIKCRCPHICDVCIFKYHRNSIDIGFGNIQHFIQLDTFLPPPPPPPPSLPLYLCSSKLSHWYMLVNLAVLTLLHKSVNKVQRGVLHCAICCRVYIKLIEDKFCLQL